MGYFEEKAINNSKIGEWKKLLDGKIETEEELAKKEQNFLFGSVFHALLSGESNDEFDKLKPHKRFEAMKMAKKIRQELGHIISKKVSVEKEYYWTQEFDEVGLVKCKAKTDLVYQDENGLHCLDYKTTASESYESFLSSVMTFDYHRQAAWYFLADDFQSYTIVGVSKSKNHDIYIVPPFSRDDVLIEIGLQECIDILKEMKNQNKLQNYIQF